MRLHEHVPRLPLLSLVFLVIASGAATLAARFSADWVRFAAVFVSLLVLVPLANESYAQHGVLGLAVVGVASALFFMWLLGFMGVPPF